MPFSALNEAPELAEVRLAVLDVVKARSHRTGSVRVFSFGVVRVQLRGVADAQAAAFQSGFFAEYLTRDLQTALARASVRFPEQLRVEVRTTEQLPGPGQDWVLVEVLNNIETEHPAPQAPPRTPRPARLLVVLGKANKTELLLTKTRTNIGRSVDVFQENGPVRQTTSRSLRTPRSIERFRANTRISSAKTNRATTGFITIAGTRAKIAACGFFAMAEPAGASWR